MGLTSRFRVITLTRAIALPGSMLPRSSPADEDIGLSVSEADMLAYMREEEKLAHDIYITLGAWWHDRVFANIAESEQQRTEAIQAMLAQ